MSTRAKRGRKATRQQAPVAEQQLTRFALSAGDGMAQRIARGLTQWRESQALTVPQAAKKFAINQTIWYRIERGNQPQTMAKHIDALCRAIDVDVTKLLEFGSES